MCSLRYSYDYKNCGMTDLRAVPMLHYFVTITVGNKQTENGNNFLTSLRGLWSHAQMTIPITIGSWSQKRVKRPKTMRKSHLRYSLMTYYVRLPHWRSSCKFLPHSYSMLPCLSTEPLDKGKMGTTAPTYQGEVLRRQCGRDPSGITCA